MKRPLAVTIIGWLFIVAGVVGLVYHVTEINQQHPFAGDAVWILIVRLLAVLGGILVLRGINAGRWLVIAWMAYHVVLGYHHSPSSLAMHAFLLIAISLLLVNGRVAPYFTRAPRRK